MFAAEFGVNEPTKVRGKLLTALKKNSYTYDEKDNFDCGIIAVQYRNYGSI